MSTGHSRVVTASTVSRTVWSGASTIGHPRPMDGWEALVDDTDSSVPPRRLWPGLTTRQLPQPGARGDLVRLDRGGTRWPLFSANQRTHPGNGGGGCTRLRRARSFVAYAGQVAAATTPRSCCTAFPPSRPTSDRCTSRDSTTVSSGAAPGLTVHERGRGVIDQTGVIDVGAAVMGAGRVNGSDGRPHRRRRGPAPAPADPRRPQDGGHRDSRTWFRRCASGGRAGRRLALSPPARLDCGRRCASWASVRRRSSVSRTVRSAPSSTSSSTATAWSSSSTGSSSTDGWHHSTRRRPLPTSSSPRRSGRTRSGHSTTSSFG